MRPVACRRHGFGASGSETPHEFAESLAPALAGAAGDMHRLADAFVEARYSDHSASAVQGDRARANWQRVQAALRAARRPRS